MEKVKLEVITELVKENPGILGFMNKDIRGTKSVILAACKVDNKAIRFATPELTSNAVFVFKSQGKNPDKLLEVYDLFHPVLKSKEIETLLTISSNPAEFANLPTETFRDKNFVQACKDCIAYHLKKKIEHRRSKNIVPTEDDIAYAENINSLVKEKINVEELSIELEDKEAKKTSSSRIRQIARDISRR